MVATRKAAKKAEELRISQIGDFKSRMGGIIELPSGVYVKVRNPGGMQAFMENGQIPNALMGMVQKGINSGKGLKPEEVMPGGKIDPDVLADLMKMLDSVTIKVVVEPKVNAVPTDEDVKTWNEAHPDDLVEEAEELRQDDLLYVDEFPEEDKQFLLQWISGGTRDLATFRERLNKNVDAVSAVAVTGDAAESDNGSDIG